MFGFLDRLAKKTKSKISAINKKTPPATTQKVGM
jgi:hypothetical protein